MSETGEKILTELQRTNQLLQAMISELSQVKYELINARLAREQQTRDGTTYTIVAGGGDVE